MKITLWGTRGSIPTPSTAHFKTVLFGGDTTCVSVQSEELLIIFDAGSGIRHLGSEMLKQKIHKASLFFTHLHWDHIQGFPFFGPAFKKETHLDLYGPNGITSEDRDEAKNELEFFENQIEESSCAVHKSCLLKKAILGQQQSIYFPLNLSAMAANMHFFGLDPKQKVRIQGEKTLLEISCQLLNHPGGSLGYRIEEIAQNHSKRRVFCFLTDTEHPPEGLQPAVQELAKDADLMIYDAQYTEEEYEAHKGWGHSTWQNGLMEARAADVKRILFSHHNPTHDDSFLLELEKEAQKEAYKWYIHASFARQFEKFELI